MHSETMYELELQTQFQIGSEDVPWRSKNPVEA